MSRRNKKLKIMKYGTLYFSMKMTRKRLEKLLSLGFAKEDVRNKRIIKFSLDKIR